jgi:hypothetical protein
MLVVLPVVQTCPSTILSTVNRTRHETPEDRLDLQCSFVTRKTIFFCVVRIFKCLITVVTAHSFWVNLKIFRILSTIYIYIFRIYLI